MKGSNLSYEDPFDSIPDDNVKEVPAVEPNVIKTGAVGEGEGKIVLTYKEGAGFDSSWTVVHAASVADALSILADPGFKALLDKSKNVAAYFRGGATQASSGGAAPQRGTPQQSQEAPGGEKRFCNHGEMAFKTGVAKASGKPYSLFSCTAPRESQCPAQFLK